MTASSPPNSPSGAPDPRQIFQVQDLLSTLKHGLEMNFPMLWVEGEISNFIAARSGHWYFTLKDERAQIRSACFRNRNLRLTRPSEGQRVLLRAQPTIYTQRGELQLIVEDLKDAGAGALHQAFEQLKQKLAAEGLFEATRKRPLPQQPRCIGVITSADGAVWHDIHSTLARRFPFAQLRLYPSLVQGALAPAQLLQQLSRASSDGQCDVLIIGRGGGSLEDLQAFNDEALARAIALSPIPVVSAVGHEVDFAISDFVADARAATPTAAAEMLSPDQRDWQLRLARLQQQLHSHTQRQLDAQRRRLAYPQQRLASASPQRRLQDRAQWLDDLRMRLAQQSQRQLQNQRARLQRLQHDLQRASPTSQMRSARQQLDQLRQRGHRVLPQQLRQARQQLSHLQQRLADLSPQQVLARGYSITRHQGQILRTPEVAAGSVLEIELAQGKIAATVSAKP